MKASFRFDLAKPLVMSLLLAGISVPAAADWAVTGAGVSQDGGYSMAGNAYYATTGQSGGRFTIIKNQEMREGGVVTTICTYTDIQNLVVNGNVATFTSAGICRSLDVGGRGTAFVSDNTFSITDNGEPGSGTDVIDVNYVGEAGIAIPGGTLMHGNFVVVSSTTTPPPEGR